MGNRTFLYTTDQLPDPDGDAPVIVAAVASANNCLPPLWRVLLSDSVRGVAQDEQQVFLTSVCDSLYAAREPAEARMFRLLDFIARDPDLADRDDFIRRTEALRAALADVGGVAYSADLNEWYALDGALPPDRWLGAFAHDCVQLWEEAERAMERGDHAAVARVVDFDPADAPGTLGFACWEILDRYSEDGGEDGGGDGAEAALYLGHSMERIAENGKYGVFSYVLDKAVVPPILDEVHPFEGGAAVAVLDGRYGYLDTAGNWLVRPSYDEAFDFSGGMGHVVRDDLSGFVDATGREVIAPRFLDGTGAFGEAGYADVCTESGFGVIDRSGTFVTPAAYAEIEWIDSLDAWLVLAGQERALLHADGRPWHAGAFDSAFGLSAGGDAILERDGKLGSWQRGGAAGLALAFDDIDELASDDEDKDRERLYVASLGTGRKARRGLYLANGEQLIPHEFSRIAPVTVQGGSGEARVVTRGDFFLVKRPGRAACGVWSRAANMPVLPLDYRSAYGVETAAGVFLAALHTDGGWVMATAAGDILDTRRHDWLVDAIHGHGYDWMVPDMLSGIAEAWNAGEPVLAGRAEQILCLHSDVREEGELDYLLRVTRTAPPIVAPRGLLGRVFSRGAGHLIEGVGDPERCARIGDIYAFGEGVDVDEQAALRWHATAASAGHADACYQYAYSLANGIGCKPDPRAAREQLERLDDHAPGLNLLGTLYEQGLGGPADPARARACYERAAGTDTHGLQNAQFNAGNCWKNGIGGPVDRHKALALFELAAARANHRDEVYPAAALAAAELNAELALEAQAAGEHDAQAERLERAMRYYHELVSMDEHGGLIGLARCYLGEYGGQADPARAQFFLKRAAGTDVADIAAQIRKEHGLGG